MSAPVSPGSRPDPAAGRSGAPTHGLLPRVVTVAGYAALLLLGFVTGIVGGVAAGWLSWLWASGATGKVLALLTLVVVLGVLFTGCRVTGWSMGSRLGAGLPAAGWMAATFSLVAFTPAGDIMVTQTPIDIAYLFGGMAVVAFATAMTEPGP